MRCPAISQGLILLYASASLPAAERITVELRPSEGVTCAELTTPQPWTVPADAPDTEAGLLRSGAFHRAGADLEFRQGEKLLVGIYTGLRSKLYSPDKYSIVQQKGKFTLTPATEAEWQSSRVLPHSRNGPGGAKTPPDAHPLEYAGRSFAPSGHHWWDAIYSTFLSADRAYMSLLTWDGTVNIPEPFGGIFQSHQMDGHYFIDLYNVATGRKIALIQGRFQDVAPGFAAMSFWIEGSRFILPVSEDMRRLVLCEVR